MDRQMTAAALETVRAVQSDFKDDLEKSRAAGEPEYLQRLLTKAIAGVQSLAKVVEELLLEQQRQDDPRHRLK